MEKGGKVRISGVPVFVCWHVSIKLWTEMSKANRIDGF